MRYTSGAAAARSDRAKGRGLNTRLAHQERGSGDEWRALSRVSDLTIETMVSCLFYGHQDAPDKSVKSGGSSVCSGGARTHWEHG